MYPTYLVIRDIILNISEVKLIRVCNIQLPPLFILSIKSLSTILASIFIKTINIANIAFLKNIMPIKLFLIKKL